MSGDARYYKLERLARGGTPRVVDLFSGCGGITVGFQRAGFLPIANVEIDAHAAATYAANFHRAEPPVRQAVFARPRDITKLEPEDLLRELYPHEPPELQTDVIVGGPPCQAYARVGRAKLRDVHDHPEAFRQDPRGGLWQKYAYFVQKLKPLAVVMENVPDALNYGGVNILEDAAEFLESEGFDCRYTLLNAVHFGVPQLRERVFLMAIHQSVSARPSFPRATNKMNLPSGYEDTRRAALRIAGKGQITFQLDEEEVSWNVTAPRFEEPSAPTHDLPNFVGAREAMEDLPPITAHLKGGMKKGARRFDDLVHYDEREPGAYAQLMRNWPGFEAGEGICDHVIRSLPRDYRIFERMEPGDDYPDALLHAKAILRETLDELTASGEIITEESERYASLRAVTVPPYDPTKFPNKWRKMESDKPARTLMAHLGKDSYSHIHYDSEQARTISVREAARLQSFPDGFGFKGAMNDAFKQIGNAVPPLLAWRIGESLRAILHRGVRTSQRS